MSKQRQESLTHLWRQLTDALAVDAHLDQSLRARRILMERDEKQAVPAWRDMLQQSGGVLVLLRHLHDRRPWQQRMRNRRRIIDG
ncbi:hypothetical protein A5757_09165 [Mycobacterium sp. 852013-51886_SCH5428379]|nr:hypothetical protein A5757_09165 [Mycobacterium sp. 852013-51886_SCH5428379]